MKSYFKYVAKGGGRRAFIVAPEVIKRGRFMYKKAQNRAESLGLGPYDDRPMPMAIEGLMLMLNVCNEVSMSLVFEK